MRLAEYRPGGVDDRLDLGQGLLEATQAIQHAAEVEARRERVGVLGSQECGALREDLAVEGERLVLAAEVDVQLGDIVLERQVLGPASFHALDVREHGPALRQSALQVAARAEQRHELRTHRDRRRGAAAVDPLRLRQRLPSQPVGLVQLAEFDQRRRQLAQDREAQLGIRFRGRLRQRERFAHRPLALGVAAQSTEGQRPVDARGLCVAIAGSSRLRVKLDQFAEAGRGLGGPTLGQLGERQPGPGRGQEA